MNPVFQQRINYTSNVSPLLYSNQVDTSYYDLTQPLIPDNTNQLNNNKALIQIPLQGNVPFNDLLRTQDILVTPYNCVKYNLNNKQ